MLTGSIGFEKGCHIRLIQGLVPEHEVCQLARPEPACIQVPPGAQEDGAVHESPLATRDLHDIHGSCV